MTIEYLTRRNSSVEFGDRNRMPCLYRRLGPTSIAIFPNTVISNLSRHFSVPELAAIGRDTISYNIAREKFLPPNSCEYDNSQPRTKIRVAVSQFDSSNCYPQEFDARRFNEKVKKDWFETPPDQRKNFTLTTDLAAELQSVNNQTVLNRITDKMITHMALAKENGAEFILFPELVIPGFFPFIFIPDKEKLLKFFIKEEELLDNPHIKRILEWAKAHNLAFAMGTAIQGKDGGLYNSTIAFDENGKLKGNRGKSILPGFDEPRPEHDDFQFEYGIFTPFNADFAIFEILGVRFAAVICHERRYTGIFEAISASHPVDEGAQIILVTYNTPIDLTFARNLNEKLYQLHEIPLLDAASSFGFTILASPLMSHYGVDQMGDGGVITPLLDYHKVKPPVEAVIVSDVDLLSGPHVRQQKYNLVRTPHHLFARAELRAVSRTEDYLARKTQLAIMLDHPDENFLREIADHLKGLRDIEEYQ